MIAVLLLLAVDPTWQPIEVVDVDAIPAVAVAVPEHPAAEAPAEVVVAVSAKAVFVNGEQVVALTGDPPAVSSSDRKGPVLIAPLYDALGEIAASGPREGAERKIALQADVAVPFALIRDIMYTAGQAEFSQFRFVVSAPAEGSP